MISYILHFASLLFDVMGENKNSLLYHGWIKQRVLEHLKLSANIISMECRFCCCPEVIIAHSKVCVKAQQKNSAMRTTVIRGVIRAVILKIYKWVDS